MGRESGSGSGARRQLIILMNDVNQNMYKRCVENTEAK